MKQKKNYKKPESEVTELEYETMILAESGSVKSFG